jgi:small GTP-binding protein
MIGPQFKLVLVGDDNVGKTTLCQRIILNIFDRKTPLTQGASYHLKVLAIDEKLVRVAIWDTNGHQIYRSTTLLCCRGAHCVAIVYSVNNRESFLSVPELISFVRDNISANPFFVLIGSKYPFPNRIVTRDEAEGAARDFGIPYFEMDAETGEGVEDGLHTIVREGIRTIPNFFDPPESAELPKKERKGLFDSKKIDSERECDSDFDSDFELEILP